jgi:putative membrane protein
MNLEQLFSPEDRERIRAAVQEAEKTTSGEIVPYVVAESDPYPEATWRGGALLGAAVLGVVALLHDTLVILSLVTLTHTVLAGFVGFALGALVVRWIPALKPHLADDRTMERRVAERAAMAFVDEEVFATRDRSGIMIFVSLLEHKVLVMGDTGINARVDQSAWTGIVGMVVEGIRSGTATEGLVRAIRACGELLTRSGLTIRPDDTDELSDSLRVGGS